MQEKDRTKIIRPKGENGDITIYRIYLKTDFYKNLPDSYSKKLYRSLMRKLKAIGELSYVGKSVYTACDRWGTHKEAAFGIGVPPSLIDRLIRKYFKDYQHLVDDVFEVEVLQVIIAQESNDITTQLSNDAEIFWIGWFHSQFNEFGWNIKQGGEEGGLAMVLLPFVEFDKAIEESLYLNRADKPVRFLEQKIGYSEQVIINNIKFHYSELGVNNYVQLRYVKLKSRIDFLLKSGYTQTDAAVFLGSNAQTRSGKLCYTKRILREVYGQNAQWGQKQNEYMKEAIESLIYRGSILPSQIALNFAHLTPDDVHSFIATKMGDYYKLLLAYLYSIGYKTAPELRAKFGLSTTVASVNSAINRYAGGMNNIPVLVTQLSKELEYFSKKHARNLIRVSFSAEDLLAKMGYKESSISDTEQIIKRLFDGLDFDRAKLLYSKNQLCH